MALIQTLPTQRPSAFSQFASSPYNSPILSVRFAVVRCSVASSPPATVVNGRPEERTSERNQIRLGLPSKGRMATDTLDLLKVYTHTLFIYLSLCVCVIIDCGCVLINFTYSVLASFEINKQINNMCFRLFNCLGMI